MSKLKLIFMGTPEFAIPTLEAILAAGHELLAVYSQPPRPAGRGQKDTPSPVHQLAQSKGLKVLTPTSLKSPEEQKTFADFKADAAIVVAYGLILPAEILKGTRLGCINVHPSLLPRWRGAAPIQRTIMAGDKETAVCTMQMDAGLDTGDVLLTEKLLLDEEMTAGDLHDKCAIIGGELVVKTLESLAGGTLKPTAQAKDGVTYASKISKEECKIDWNKAAQEIHCHIRGLTPSPGAYFIHRNEKIKVLKAKAQPHIHSTHATGTVVDDHLTITCKDGVVNILEVKRAGKKAMSAAEMLRGYPIPAGTKLE